MTDMERRAIEIQSILQSLLDRQDASGESVGAILHWKGTVESSSTAIDVSTYSFEIIEKWFAGEGTTTRGIWMLACEHNGNIAPIEYTSENSGEFNFPYGASATVTIDTDPETGDMTILMSGYDDEGDPIDVKLYSIF